MLGTAELLEVLGAIELLLETTWDDELLETTILLEELLGMTELLEVDNVFWRHIRVYS